LPLADGYETTFRNLDLMKMKPKLLALKVAGSDTVSVPAGSFAAWRVEITSAEAGPDKITVWVSKDAPKAVKLMSVLPQGNGAQLIAELK
jgi:hypothetical protein